MSTTSKAPIKVWLTRSEAARYVGGSSESVIRAAEDKGLEALRDIDGRYWHKSEDLDKWSWQTKQPSASQKERILREAQKARQKEKAERARKATAEEQRELAEWEAQQELQRRQWDAEDKLREAVRQKAKKMREEFESTYMDERMAGRAIGFESSIEARGRLRDLVNQGLLRRFESPCEPRVEVSWNGDLSEVESSWPLCSGGPFYLREEVLALRHDVAAHVKEQLPQVPSEMRAAVETSPFDQVMAEIIRALLDKLK